LAAVLGNMVVTELMEVLPLAVDMLLGHPYPILVVLEQPGKETPEVLVGQ
jgi:hypothetical protein